jgi:hypothetical protein
MKYFKIITTLFVCSILTFYSCNDDKKAPKEDNSKATEVKDSTTEAAKATPPLKEPAQNALGVWHYTCRIGCPGGAGKADKCKTCGNILVHNTTYHDKAPNLSNTSASPMVNPSTTPKAPEPAQNAAGVWHYTCTNGCAGGAGGAGTCGTCNGTLAHNQAYH